MLKEGSAATDPKGGISSVTMMNPTDGEYLPQQTEASQTEIISDRTTDKEEKNHSNKQPDIIIGQASRIANIYRDASGNPRGAAVWLNSIELDAIGIDTDDADAVEIRIEDGDLQLVPARGDKTQ